jgi:hypothetical protein
MLVAIVKKHLNDDLLGGYTNVAGTSPTLFSVIQKPVSDAQKIGSASEKSVLVPQTVVSTVKTIVLIVQTKVSIAGAIVSGTSTMVSAAEKIVSLQEKIFSMPKNIVSVSPTVVGVSSTIFGVSETLVWETKTMVAKPSTIFWLTKKMVSASQSRQCPVKIALQDSHIGIRQQAQAGCKREGVHNYYLKFKRLNMEFRTAEVQTTKSALQNSRFHVRYSAVEKHPLIPIGDSSERCALKKSV